MAERGTHLNFSAGVASVSVAFILVCLKLWALGSTQALSVAASLTDSALDMTMSLFGLVAIIYAARPADEDHAFGHTSVEDLAALEALNAEDDARGWALTEHAKTVARQSADAKEGVAAFKARRTPQWQGR